MSTRNISEEQVKKWACSGLATDPDGRFARSDKSPLNFFMGHLGHLSQDARLDNQTPRKAIVAGSLFF